MSSTSVAAGDRQLERLSSDLGISDAGREWLTAALDPYHDTALSICGYPDVEESPSVTQVVKSSFTLSAPSTATGNWDCHISSFPWIVGADINGIATALADNNNIIVPIQFIGAPNGGLGGLMYDAVPTTPPPTPTFMNSAAPTFRTLDGDPGSGPAHINKLYTVGAWRQIAHGFEVINTTSDLNIQGLVTSYACPFPQRGSKSVASVLSADAGSPPTLSAGTIGVIQASMVPITTAAAMLLPGSRQWKAKEGAYIVPRLNNQDLTVGIDNTCVALTSTADTYAPNTIAGLVSAVHPVPNTGTVLFNVNSFSADNMYLTDFNWGGAYFTGLSQSTTLTVNVVRVFERFPSIQLPSDSQLVVLAKPSPKYDPQAMEAYSAASAYMPTGVPQRMNGIGEWFREAVQEVRNVVAPALAAIPHPFAQGIAGALRVGGSIADSYDKKVVVVPAPAPPVQIPAGRVYTPTGDTAARIPRTPKLLAYVPRPKAATARKPRQTKKTPMKQAQQLLQ